jgi:hypothetical protein
LQLFFTNGLSQTIPATHQNAPGALELELSAAPLLLQRIVPMPSQSQLEALGTLLLMAAATSFDSSCSGFLRPNASRSGNFAHLNQCRIDSLGPFGAGQ